MSRFSMNEMRSVGFGPMIEPEVKYLFIEAGSISISGPVFQDETKMQYSAVGCAFSDFPLNKSEALTRLEARNYLLDYAQAFDLHTKTKLNTQVVDIRRHADYDANGRWTVKYKE